MITERSIVNALIVIGVLVLMPFAVSSAMMQFDYTLSALILGFFALMAAFFLVKEKLSFGPLLAIAIPGSVAFLPYNLTYSNLACAALILYYVTGYVLIRQKRIRLGMPRFFWPILILTGIMLYHNHDLNVRAVGSDTEGDRPVLLLYMTVIAYFCGINLTAPAAGFVSRLPWYMIVISVVSSIPYVITSVFPAFAPALSMVTSVVNSDAYFAEQSTVVGGSDEGINRLTIYGVVAVPIQAYLVSYYPIGTWFRPDRWWVLGLTLLCTYGVLLGGFRNGIFTFAIIIFAGAWCYYAWRALIIPIAGFLAMLLLVGASSNNAIPLPVSHLPKMVQRSMSFLPADWDPEVIQSAASSNEFRKNIIDVYFKEYASKSPWLGNGYEINTALFDEYTASTSHAPTADEVLYYQAKTFIEGKMFHTGWVSLYDAVGIIGFVTFIYLGVMELYTLAGWIFEAKVDRRSTFFPCYVWLFANIIASTVGFFVVFGDFLTSMQYLLIYGIIISQINDLRQVSDVPVARSEADAGGELTRPGGGRYGYGYSSRY